MLFELLIVFGKWSHSSQNIDLIYYTGDFGDHFEWLTSRDSVKDSIKFVTETVKRNLPGIPVAMVLGNHDIHPSNA